MLLTDEEIQKIIEGVGTSADDLRHEESLWGTLAKAQLKKDRESIRGLEPPIITTKSGGTVSFYAGYQRAKDDMQSLLEEVE